MKRGCIGVLLFMLMWVLMLYGMFTLTSWVLAPAFAILLFLLIFMPEENSSRTGISTTNTSGPRGDNCQTHHSGTADQTSVSASDRWLDELGASAPATPRLAAELYGPRPPTAAGNQEADGCLHELGGCLKVLLIPALVLLLLYSAFSFTVWLFGSTFALLLFLVFLLG
jgi:hypothetical protein